MKSAKLGVEKKGEDKGEKEISFDGVCHNGSLHGDAKCEGHACRQRVQIITDFSAQFDPKIDGSYMVYIDNRAGNYDVYLYNIETGEEGPDRREPRGRGLQRHFGQHRGIHADAV